MPRDLQLTRIDDYFARKNSSDCAADCEELIDDYYDEARLSGRLAIYRTSYFNYFEGFLNMGQIVQRGEQGEISGISVNNYHNFIKHRVNQLCQQKISYEPQTIDNTHASMEQVRLAKGILNIYADRSDICLDDKLREAATQVQLFGESFISVLWDSDAGNTIAPDFQNSTMVKEGDISIKTHDPLSVVRDIYDTEGDSSDWVLIRQEKNKVNLAALYPHFENEILAERNDSIESGRQFYPISSRNSNIIWQWMLFHKRTAAVPSGRKMTFIDSSIVLDDGPLPDEYETLPVFRMRCEKLIGTPWGYCDTFDLLPICSAVNRLHSNVLSNNLTFGLQHILVPKDANINEATLGGGLSIIEWDAAKGENYIPKPLNLTQSSPETYNYINTLTQTLGTLSGINEVVRGNPDLILKGQTSGAALALMATQSIQFNTDMAAAYQNLAQNVGTAIIQILAKKAIIPRAGQTIGLSGKFKNKKFSGSDLNNIKKVIVKTGNPLAQTTSGKLQIAEALLQGGFIKNRQDYISVLETGSLEPILEAYDMEISLIKDENDSLGIGDIPGAVVFDNHVMHIPEHQILLASVAARQNPVLVKSVTDHIQSHLNFLAGDATHGPMNPILATIGNQPTLPPNSPSQVVMPKVNPPQAGPPGGQGGPVGGSNVQGGVSAPPELPTPNVNPNLPSSVKVAQGVLP